MTPIGTLVLIAILSLVEIPGSLAVDVGSGFAVVLWLRAVGKGFQ